MVELEFKEYTGKPCKSKSAYEFIPKQRLSLELEPIAERLRQKKLFIEAETPFLLMLQIKGFSVSFFKSGKILVKNIKEEPKARALAEDIVKAIQ